MPRRHKAPFRPCQTRDSFKERLVTLGMDAQYVSWQPAAAFAVRRDHFDLYLIDLSRQLTADLIDRPLMLRQAHNQSINQPIKHSNKQSNAYAVKVTVLQMPHPSGTPSSFFNFLYVHIEFDRSISASMHKQALHSAFREKLIDRIAERLRPEHASERHYDQSIKEVIKRQHGSSIPRSADEEYQRVRSSQPQPRVTAADLIALSLECAHTVEPLFKFPSIYHSINQFTLEIIEPDVECMIHQEDDLDSFLKNMNDYIKVAMKTLVVVDSLGTNTQTVLLTIRDLKLVITCDLNSLMQSQIGK